MKYRNLIIYLAGIFILIIILAFSGVMTIYIRNSKPSYFFWTSKGSSVKVKPKYGRQIMPDKPLEKTEPYGVLLFSNSPETLTKEKLPALLFRCIAKGNFRILLHHQNNLGYDAFLNFIMINESEKNVYLHIKKSSNCEIKENGKIKYSEETISSDPAIAGRNAFIRWLNSSNKKQYAKILKPKETFTLSYSFKNGATLSSMTDLKAEYENGENAALRTAVCAVANPEDSRCLDILNLKMAEDPVSKTENSSRIRGLFDYISLKADFTYRLSEVSYSEISSASSGIYSFSNPGEYYESLKEKDLYFQKNSGNFGVCYLLNLKIINDLKTEENASLIAAAAGGRSLVILKELSKEKKIKESDIIFADKPLLSSQGMHDAWIFDNIKLEQGQSITKRYIYTLPCGCNGPVRFYVVTSDRLKDLLINSYN